MDKLIAISAFRRIVDLGSFVATANDMSVSPAMVTRYVAQLEQQLGTRLLTRSTRSVRLTEQGHAYYQSVCGILDELESADQRAQAGSQSPTGLLRLTAPVELGEQLLPNIIDQFQQQYPAVSVSLDLTDRQVDLFGENYDLAIRAGTLSNPDLIARKFAQLSLVLCASPDYLASNVPLNQPSDLKHHNCLLNPNIENSGEWQFVVNGKASKQKVQSKLSINSLKMLVHACMQGAGVIYAPRLIVEDALNQGSLNEMLEDYLVPAMDVYLVYPERTYMPAKVRSFIDVVSTLT